MSKGDRVLYKGKVAEVQFVFPEAVIVKFRLGKNVVHRYCFLFEVEPFLQICF